MNLERIIPSDEPVRLLNAVLEELDYRKLTATCSRIGRIEYSPRLLFEVVLYACCRGIYSSREIERACRENVNFMYLLEGQNVPDHNTIARFRASICRKRRKIYYSKWYRCWSHTVRYRLRNLLYSIQMQHIIKGLLTGSRKVRIYMTWISGDMDVRTICCNQPQSLVQFKIVCFLDKQTE